MLDDLREQVWQANLGLRTHDLVTWTSGNVSAFDEASNLVVIKPSGVKYDSMQVTDMVVVDLDGVIVEGHRAPSSDTKSHLEIYRRRSDVRSIVHTHSRYATAYAALGQPIPCCLTAVADEFGGAIPCAPYAAIGGEEIGEAVVTHLGRSPAVLLAQHGVFAVGASIDKALQAAVMVEDVAHTMAVATSLGTPVELTDEQVNENWDRYQNRYGTERAAKGSSDDL